MKFDIILADPPWSYERWSDQGYAKHISEKYRVLTTEDLCALPVADLAAADSALFLWTTWPNLPCAFKVMGAWGFTYKSLAWEWIKLTKNEKLHIGLGFYFRANPEPCILGIRGSMPVAVRSERNLLLAKIQSHSQKPEESYCKIERVYPRNVYSHRLELFASRHSLRLANRYGYVPVGYDVDNQCITQVLPRLIKLSGAQGLLQYGIADESVSGGE